MLVATEFNLWNFEAWSGAIPTKEKILQSGKGEEFNALLDSLFSDKDFLEDVEINDFLWFDYDLIFEELNIESD